MDFEIKQPWTLEEIRHHVLELQRHVDRCRKQLEIAECELVILTDQLTTGSVPALTQPTGFACRLAG